MRTDDDKNFPPCPMATSSKNDEYIDLCKITGKECPFYLDEGMSVCKSKPKCFKNFIKKKSKIKFKEAVKLIFSDTKTFKNTYKRHNPNKSNRKTRECQEYEVFETTDDFIINLETALKERESNTISSVHNKE